MERILNGETLRRQEGAWAYGDNNEGIPIREEVVARHGDIAITRNSYGSLCLNTPNVLFADVDAYWNPPHRLSPLGCLTLIIVGVCAGLWQRSWLLTVMISIGGPWLASSIANFINAIKRPQGEAMARQKAMNTIHEFIIGHPTWHLRVYETPAGYRLLGMHDVFDPDGEIAQQALDTLGSDPNFSRLCALQSCFRARVSPKYWRTGYRPQHHLPRARWPFTPAQAATRDKWVTGYNSFADRFASCRFIEQLGSSTIHPEAESVRALHDELCRSDSALPLA